MYFAVDASLAVAVDAVRKGTTAEKYPIKFLLCLQFPYRSIVKTYTIMVGNVALGSVITP